MSIDDPERLWARWMDVWNGDLSGAERVVHPGFTLHRFPPPPVPDRGREGLLAWIRRMHSVFSGLRFTVEVGPIVNGDLVAGRWIGEGVYQGGIRGSAAPAGTHVGFHGNDICRVEGRMFRELWLSDDVFDLMQQVGAIPSR